MARTGRPLAAPDGIEFHKVFLANGAQRLDLSGRYSYSKAYRVEGTIQSFDLGGLRELSGIDLADLDGTLDGTLTLSGVPSSRASMLKGPCATACSSA